MMREVTAAGARPRRIALHGLEALTPRELQVLALVANGATNREIAGTLYLSPHTVKEHTSSLYRKLGVRNLAGYNRKLHDATERGETVEQLRQIALLRLEQVVG